MCFSSNYILYEAASWAHFFRPPGQVSVYRTCALDFTSRALLTNNLACVVKDMKTLTCSYKIGVTNLSFTLCLTNNIDLSGRKIDDCLLPRSLRIKDKAIENSPFAEIVDFIFVKTYGSSIYSELTYSDNTKTLPDTIKSLVDAKFFIQQQH